ncbi:hypothetical protein [Chitinimonas sp.]|uniref:hypothetical protein n=1 Tax=Chitinimonas sp. TaxID=1934313 RepID=UPI0035AF3894
MSPDISEFSYGYALTETLIRSLPFRLRAAPIFPSLNDEGKPGGGYDVEIPFPGFPLFLQFKLSHRMVRYSAFEAQLGLLPTPFFRMHLRPTKHSQQHPMLLALEASGAPVFYVAPHFDTPAELNDAYINRKVVERSVFFRPSEIGPLPDDDNHHVSFRDGHPVYLCSNDPRMVRESSADQKQFLDDIAEGFWRYERILPNEDSVRSWNEKLIAIVEKHKWHFRWYGDHTVSALRNRSPANTLAYLARTFFGCNVIVLAPEEGSNEIAV